MGVFSKFKKTAKSLVFDKDPLGIIGKVQGIKQRQVEKSEAYQAGVRDAKKSWTLTTAQGKRTMAPVIKAIPTKTVEAPTPAPSKKVFSAHKSKIPSYKSIPAFAKNYTKVPPRTFIRDLSDANLTRVLGPATPATPKAVIKSAAPKAVKVTARPGPFEGLPKVNLPSTKPEAASAAQPTSNTPPVVKVSKSQPVEKAKELPSAPFVIGEGLKKAGRYAVTAGLATAGIAAIKMSTQEPRKAERRGAERRVTEGTAPEIERRILAVRREVANRVTTGTKQDRPNYGAVREKIKTEQDVALKEKAEVRVKKAKPGDTVGEGKLGKPRIRRTGVAVIPGSEKVPLKIATPIGELPQKTLTPPVSIEGTPKTESAAIATSPPKPNVVAPAKPARKPRVRKIVPGPVTPIQATDLVKAPTKAPTTPLPFAPLVSAEHSLKVAKNLSSDQANRLNAGREKAGLPPVHPPRESPEPTKKLGYYEKGGEFDRLTAAKKAENVVEPASGRPPETEKPKVRRGRPPKAAAVTEEKAKGPGRFTLKAHYQQKAQEKLLRETPAAAGTIEEESSLDFKRRQAKKNRMAERAAKKAETNVAISQTSGAAKAMENKERQKLIERMAKKQGVQITKLPPATEEVMHPERFEPPKPTVYEEYRYGQTETGKLLGEGKLGKGKAPAPKPETPAAAKPISSEAELRKAIEKAKAENAQLKASQGQPTISPKGEIKATAPPRVRMKSKRKGLAPKPTINPEVVTKAQPKWIADAVKAVKEAPPMGPSKEPQVATAQPKAILRKAGDIGVGKLKGKGGKLGGKLGVAALIGAGVGATMAGKEAKASTGNYTAAAKAAGKSLYESGREMGKFAMGGAIAARMPGVMGAAARFALGRALPLVGAVSGAVSIAQAADAGMGAFRAKRAAEKERKGSQAKYGTVAAATATRHARQRAKNLGSR